MTKQLEGYNSSTKNKLVDAEFVKNILPILPERIQLRQEWKLKFSLEQDGASLKTLYKRAERDPADKQQHGYLLVLRDARNNLFGAYLNERVRPSEGRYRGDSSCFLWRRLEDGSIKHYPYTGVNDFMIFCTHHFISFGGGDGHYGLWIDDSLDKGVSYPSVTYSNEPLSGQGPKFDIIGLEFWQI